MTIPTTAPNPWFSAHNILAARMDNIGDVVMLGPALRAVKAASPDARITLLASPAGSTAAPLLPWVDDVITWRAVWQDLGHLAFDPGRERELIDLLAQREFDGALLFTSFSQTPHALGYACYLAGIPLRAGESKEFGGSVLTTELRSAPDDLHQAERNLRLVEALGFVARDRQLAIHIPDEARRRAAQILAEAGIDPSEPFILLHPGASAQARRYPAERYGEVARLLTARGHAVLVTGIEREAALLATVHERAPEARLLIGRTTLAEYAALVECAALVICNDTLPMHLADATRTPEVALYSGTEYESQWQPRATRHRLLIRHVPCQPCYRFECPIGLPCLDIAPAEVVAAVEEVLGDTLSGRTSTGLASERLPAVETARLRAGGHQPQSPPTRTTEGLRTKSRRKSLATELAPGSRWPQSPPARATDTPRTGVGARPVSPAAGTTPPPAGGAI